MAVGGKTRARDLLSLFVRLGRHNKTIRMVDFACIGVFFLMYGIFQFSGELAKGVHPMYLMIPFFALALFNILMLSYAFVTNSKDIRAAGDSGGLLQEGEEIIEAVTYYYYHFANDLVESVATVLYLMFAVNYLSEHSDGRWMREVPRSWIFGFIPAIYFFLRAFEIAMQKMKPSNAGDILRSF